MCSSSSSSEDEDADTVWKEPDKIAKHARKKNVNEITLASQVKPFSAKHGMPVNNVFVIDGLLEELIRIKKGIGRHFHTKTDNNSNYFM